MNVTVSGTERMAASSPSLARWRACTWPLFIVRLVSIAWIMACIVRWFREQPVVGWFLGIGVAGLLAASVVRWGFLLLMAEPPPVAPQSGLRVAVVTTFVPDAEPLDMLERTLWAMTKVEYPHDTWVLDEGNDQSVMDVCERVGAHHFSRKDKPRYQQASGRFQRATKHGNYNAWLDELGFERYDVMAGVDPDQVLYRDFLTATLGQLRDRAIAYVQSPQVYHNAGSSLIARGSDEESRDFFWITQRAFQRFGSPSLIGAHNLHRMAALKSVGGLAPHVADDLLLTLRYQLAGWRGSYVPRVLARGLAPSDWATYIKQQRRWARSLLDVKLRIYPRLTKELSPWARTVGLLQGLTYLQDAIVAICFLVAVVGMLFLGVPDSMATLIAAPATVASLILLVVTGLYPHLFHGSGGSRGFYWRSAWLRFAKWPFTLQALWDVAIGGSHGYELTLKTGAPPVRKLLFWPHLLLSGILFCVLAASITMSSPNALLPEIVAGIFVLASIVLSISNLLPAQFSIHLRPGESAMKKS